MGNHNYRRLRELGNIVPGMPVPRPLIGTNDIKSDVLALHEKIGLKKKGNGAVLAVEHVLMGSPEWFADPDPKVELGKLKAVGRLVANLTVHLDEATSHVHLVRVPAVLKVDRRSLRYRSEHERAAAVPTWQLCDRDTGGPGQLKAMHSSYAAAMAPLGMVRGRSNTGAKHVPYRGKLAHLQAQVDAAVEAAEIARQSAVVERLAAERDRTELARLRLEVEALKASADELFDTEFDRKQANDQAHYRASVELRTGEAELRRATARFVAEQADLAAARQREDEARVERHRVEDEARAHRLKTDDVARQAHADRMAAEHAERVELADKREARFDRTMDSLASLQGRARLLKERMPAAFQSDAAFDAYVSRLVDLNAGVAAEGFAAEAERRADRDYQKRLELWQLAQNVRERGGLERTLG